MGLTLYSPAKINLFLRVLKRREDGYHEIASLLQAVSLVDKLHFILSKKDRFSCSDSRLSRDRSNLVLKALKLFRERSGLVFPVSIHLEKKIPVQSGLGGGSSNAATTLWGLNELAGRPHTEAELIQWGEAIGSDVPFFFSNGSAYCRGRGEKVTSVQSLPQKQFWIAVPPFGCETAKVYGALNLGAVLNRDPDLFISRFLKGEEFYFNDLEEAAYRVSPSLAHFKQSLILSGYFPVVLTGSGSAFFCFGEGRTFSGSANFYSVTCLSREKGGWYSSFNCEK